MSMLLLVGQVVNVFEAPKGTNKETGESFGGTPRVQILAENELQNGDTKLDLVNLSVENESLYKGLKGKKIAVPVGAYVSKGIVAFYALKGALPSVHAGAGGADTAGRAA
jgi:hypothetical protein